MKAPDQHHFARSLDTSVLPAVVDRATQAGQNWTSSMEAIERQGNHANTCRDFDTLAASQTQVMTFFQGLSPQDLERPATESDVPGAAPWHAKDHFTRLVESERSIQRLLRRTLAGDTRDVLL
jgi:hypothetical protein